MRKIVSRLSVACRRMRSPLFPVSLKMREVTVMCGDSCFNLNRQNAVVEPGRLCSNLLHNSESAKTSANSHVCFTFRGNNPFISAHVPVSDPGKTAQLMTSAPQFLPSARST